MEIRKIKILRRLLLIPMIVFASLVVYKYCSYSRRIGQTRFYLVRTHAISKEGKSLAGLFYKPVDTNVYQGENLHGFPKQILWNEKYIISKNIDAANPYKTIYIIVNMDSIEQSTGGMWNIHEFQDERAYYNYLTEINLSEDQMNHTDNHITWLERLFE